METDGAPIIVRETFTQPLQTVWSAITEADQMRKWFFAEIEEFRPELGFQTRFNVAVGDNNFIHLWHIINLVAEEKIVYCWRYEKYPGDSVVTFFLAADNSGTQLTLTHEGMDSFPKEVPEFSRESCRAGWQYFIKERLKNYLDDPS